MKVGKLLREAAARGSLEDIKKYLPDAVDKEKERALIAAITNSCSTEIVSTLLNAGAQPRGSSLSAAVQRGLTDVIRLLLNHGLSLPREILSVAVQRERLDMVPFLLTHGANIDATDKKNLTALMFAARRGCEESTRVLLDAGANINKLNENGRSALYYALRADHTNLVESLVRRGALIPSNRQLQEVIQDAAINGNLDRVKFVLKLGLKVNDDVNDTMTALMSAARHGHIDIVRVLLDAGADVNRANAAKRTALYYSIIGKHEDVALLLFEHGARSDGFENLLVRVAEQGDLRILQILLRGGIDIDSEQYKGMSALMSGARFGKEQIVRALIEAGADVNKKNAAGRNALYYALKGEHESIAELLKKHGAEMQDMSAEETVRLLAAREEGIDRQNGTGQTELMKAVREGDVEMVRALLNAGADINKVDRRGCPVLYFALKRGRLALAEELVQRGARGNSFHDLERIFINAVAVGDTRIVQLLADKGVNIEADAGDGLTSLMRASRRGDLEMIRILINAGADVNRLSERGESALQFAVEQHHAEAAAILRDAGANMLKLENRDDGVQNDDVASKTMSLKESKGEMSGKKRSKGALSSPQRKKVRKDASN